MQKQWGDECSGATKARHLLSFDDLRRWQFKLSAENAIPESAGNAESVLEIGKVVLKMVFLKFLIIGRQSVADEDN